jgi:flagellar biosynthetic protein FliR
MPFDILKLPMMLPGFALVLFRMLGLSISAPIFSAAGVPRRVKIGLAMVCAMMVYPLAEPTLPTELTLAQALVGVAGEMMIGVAIGFALHMVFVASEIGGLLIAQQAGLALGQVYNPALGSETTPLGQLLFFVVLGLFLAMNGHVAAVRGLLESFSYIPPMTFTAAPSVVQLLVGLLTSAFVLAVRLAGPGLTALLLVTLAMGFISRTVPQLNILAVGFSIRSTTALVMVAVSLTAAQDVLVNGIVDMMQTIQALLQGQT